MENKEAYGISINEFNKKYLVIIARYDGVEIIPKPVGFIQLNKLERGLKKLDRDYTFKIKNGKRTEMIEDYLEKPNEYLRREIIELAGNLYLENR